MPGLVEMNLKNSCSSGGKEVKAELGRADRCALDSNSSPDKKCSEKHLKKKWPLSRFELLGLIIMALATFWICGLPPANPAEWFHWFFNRSGHWRTPFYSLSIFLILIYLLVARDSLSAKWKTLKDFFPGSIAVSGVTILRMNQDSIAAEAGMQRGDVIVEYASERDLTLEKLAAVMAKKEAEPRPVSVVFVRDRGQHSCKLPPGPLGISAVNTTVDVLVKTE